MTANHAATRIQTHPLRKGAATDLRAPGLLARRPIIGITMFILGSLMFGALTLNLYAHGPLLAWDNALAHMLPAIALKSPPFVKIIMDSGFYIGDQLVGVYVFLMLIYFIHKRFWRELTMVAIGPAGSTLLFLTLSNLIGRPRPPTQVWIIVNLPGFPSGHTIMAVAFFGLLAYLLVPQAPSVFWKWVVAITAIFVMVFIGFTRVFTGGHYLTDVLAGYAVGIAWAGLIYTLIEVYFQKRKNQNVYAGRSR